MVLLLVGLGVLLLAIVPFWLSLYHQRKAQVIRRTQTSSAAELEDLRAHAAATVGPGYFAQIVEVKGIGECPTPLTAPMSQTLCAAYRTLVEREYEEDRWERDAQGRSRQSWHRGTETVSREEQSVEFFVRDGSGKVRVNPDGARIEYVKVADRFEPAAAEGTRIAFGGFSVTVPGGLSGSRTLGYQTTEEALLLGRPVYVLGEANDSAGSLVIRKPSESSTAFVISHRSESDILASATRWVRWLQVGGAILAFTGVGLVAAGVITLLF